MLRVLLEWRIYLTCCDLNGKTSSQEDSLLDFENTDVDRDYNGAEFCSRKRKSELVRGSKIFETVIGNLEQAKISSHYLQELLIHFPAKIYVQKSFMSKLNKKLILSTLLKRT